MNYLAMLPSSAIIKSALKYGFGVFFSPCSLILGFFVFFCSLILALYIYTTLAVLFIFNYGIYIKKFGINEEFSGIEKLLSKYYAAYTVTIQITYYMIDKA